MRIIVYSVSFNSVAPSSTRVSRNASESTNRPMSAVLFKDNHLIRLHATVLPAGDYASSDTVPCSIRHVG
jgi:hypothetical protein